MEGDSTIHSGRLFHISTILKTNECFLTSSIVISRVVVLSKTWQSIGDFPVVDAMTDFEDFYHIATYSPII